MLVNIYNKSSYNVDNPDDVRPIELIKFVSGKIYLCHYCKMKITERRNCPCRNVPEHHVKHIKSISNQVKAFKSDLDIDRFLLGQKPNKEYIHIVCENGTHLYRASLLCVSIIKSIASGRNLYHYPGYGTTWKKLDETQLDKILARWSFKPVRLP